MPKSKRVMNSPNTPVSIHDMETRQRKAVSALTALTGGLDPKAIASAMKSMLRRYVRHCGGGGKYSKPHQGAKECERRIRQREAGTHGVDSGKLNKYARLKPGI